LKQNLTILELFSGIGGFTKGFLNAGYTFANHYFSEVDKHAIANYQYNFKNAKPLGAVTTICQQRIERPHIITFGSPCQDFSLAGKQQGLNGQRSSLIMEAIKIIAHYKPSVFIWENVKGTFSSNGGADFWAILAAFANIGCYTIEWQLLNTSWFLPQNRERIYLVGHLATASEPGVFPIKESDFRTFEGSTNTSIVRAFTAGGKSGGHHSGMTLIKEVNPSLSYSITASYSKGKYGKSRGTLIKQLNNSKQFGNQPKQQNRVYDPSGIMATIGAHRSDNKTNILVEKPIVKSVLTPDRIEKRQNGRRFKETNEPSFTLTSQDLHGVQINQTIRRLTEIECERLQGFPDDWTKFGKYNGEVKQIAKTQRYKLIGNAVTTNVVSAIASKLNIIK